MDSLRPCPFCGGEAFVNDDPTGNGGKPHMSGNVGLGRLWSVECDECGADGGFWQDKDIAIAAWNTRYHSEFEETVIKAWKEIKDYQERTCEVLGEDYDELLDYWETELSCGHVFNGMARYVDYCPKCGAKVIGGNDA